MKVLIFGGAGFIGTNLSVAFIKKGHEVVVIDNLSRRGVDKHVTELSKLPGLTYIYGDVSKKKDFSLVPRGISCMINLAANPSIPKSIKNPIYDFQVNVGGHINILEYSRTHGKIPVIFASSSKVYTDKLNNFPMKELRSRYVYRHAVFKHGIPETADVDGYEGYTNSPYGASKLAAEKYSREYWKYFGVPIVINRMGCIYGLYQEGAEDQGWVDWFIRAKIHSKPLHINGNGKQVRDILFAEDLADLYVFESEHMNLCNGRTFNVGGGSEEGFHASLLDVINYINENFPGKPLRYTFRDWRLGDHKIFISNNNGVTRLTGWRPKTRINRGLQMIWDQYTRHKAFKIGS